MSQDQEHEQKTEGQSSERYILIAPFLPLSPMKISDGKITAYLGPALLGVDIRTLKFNNDPIGQRTYDAIHEAPQGNIATVDYSFPKPGKTERVPKQFIETLIGNQACGVAHFK